MEGEGWKKGTEDGTILLTREYIYIYIYFLVHFYPLEILL